ncbi:MAG: ArnT family glycosyltransferase [Acidimicrobiales bacterium]
MSTATLESHRDHAGSKSPVADRLAPRLFLWLHAHRVDIAVLGLLLVVTGILHGIGMTNNPERGDDEGTYMAQAWALQQGELAHYTYWYDHPPLGWVQLAGFEAITGALDDSASSVAAGRHAMLLVKLVSVVALYVLGRRLGLAIGWSATTVALFALGPLALPLQRGVWLDNIGVMWALIAFALAADRRGRMDTKALASVCLAIAVLTKATLLLVAPFVFYVLWQSTPPRLRTMTMAVSGAIAGLLVSMFPLMALLRGELIPSDSRVSLISAAHWQLFDRESSGSLFASGTDAANMLDSWLGSDGLFLTLGLASIVPALAIRRLRPIGLCLLLHALMPLRGGYLPVPYLIVVIPLVALCIGGVGDTLHRAATGRRAAPLPDEQGFTAPGRIHARALLDAVVPARVIRSPLAIAAGIVALTAIVVATTLWFGALPRPGAAYHLLMQALFVFVAVASAWLVLLALRGHRVLQWTKIFLRRGLVEEGTISDPTWVRADAGRHTEHGRRRRVAAGIGAGAIAVTLLGGLGPTWVAAHTGDEFRTDDADAGVSGAQAWIEDNVPRDAVIVIEDSIWVDLVRAGFPRENVIWYFKVDLDPAVDETWRTVDYVSLHDYVAADPLPIVGEMIERGTPVATFGEGIQKVTIWEVSR